MQIDHSFVIRTSRDTCSISHNRDAGTVFIGTVSLDLGELEEFQRTLREVLGRFVDKPAERLPTNIEETLRDAGLRRK